MQDVQIAHPRQGATEATIKLEVPVGELVLADTSSSDMAVEGTVRLPEGVELEQDCRVRGETLLCSLGARHKRKLNVGFRDSPRWRLRLARELPLDLRLETGAGEAELDLSALSVTNLDVEAGVGKTSVTLPRHGDIRGRIKAGVGEMTVRVPHGLAARIRISTGIGSIQVGSRFRRTTNAYETADYHEATDKIDLRIEAGVGKVAVESLG